VNFRNSTLLCVGAHTDDVELGCGGTVSRALSEGARVCVATFSIARASVPEGWPDDTLRSECIASLGSLGIKEADRFIYDYPVRHFPAHRQEILETLVTLNRSIAPDLVLTHSHSDLHQDHQVIHVESTRAFKRRSVFCYELPWNTSGFRTEAFVGLTEEHVAAKWRALERYASQHHLARRYFSREVVEGLARVRGTATDATFAEAFEVFRLHAGLADDS